MSIECVWVICLIFGVLSVYMFLPFSTVATLGPFLGVAKLILKLGEKVMMIHCQHVCVNVDIKTRCRKRRLDNAIYIFWSPYPLGVVTPNRYI